MLSLGGSKTTGAVMTEIATVRVQILGREFPVACPTGQEHELKQRQSCRPKNARDSRKNGNSALERLAVMAALNIAHEHLTGETTGQDQELKRLADRIARMNDCLRQAG